MKLPSSLDLLKDRDFRAYFTAYAFHDLGVDTRLVGMGWLALELTHSPLWVGIVTGIGGLTMAAFSPLAGVVVDRSNRRNLLIAVRASLMLVFLLAAILVISGVVEPWHLVVLGLAIGGVRAFAGPTLRVFLLDLVGTDRMLTANSLVMASSSAGELVGPAIVGVLIAWAGVGSVFLMSASALAMAAVLMFRVNANVSVPSISGNSMFQDLKSGIDYVRRTPPIPALFGVTLTQFPTGVIIPLMPVYARDVLSVGPMGLGLMSAFMGAGFLVGSLVAGSLSGIKNQGFALIWTAAMWDVAMVVFGFSRDFPLSLGLLFVMGFGGSLHVVLLITLIQTKASAAMGGRVMALYGLVTAGYPLGFLLGGATAQAFGNEMALILGMLGGTPILILIYASSPALRRS